MDDNILNVETFVPAETEESKIYNTSIKSKIDEIKSICEKNNLPFFCYFATSEDCANCKTALLTAGACGKDEKTDKIPDFINILNGFGTCIRSDFEVENFNDEQDGLEDEIFDVFEATDSDPEYDDNTTDEN